jgi:hypothetical protein
MSEKFTTDPLLGKYTLLGPMSRRSQWTKSRLVVLEDGTTMPVLQVLAREKFGTWDEKEKRPFWKDKDWTNETVDNVELVEVTEHRHAGRAKSQFGVPSNTKAYHKKWREANPKRTREASRRYHERQKLLAEAARTIVDGTTVPLVELDPQLADANTQGFSDALGTEGTPASASILDRLEELVGEDGAREPK